MIFFLDFIRKIYQDKSMEKIHKNIIENTLSKFEGVQTLYHHETKSVLLSNLNAIEQLHEVNEYHEKNYKLGGNQKDHFQRKWENISYSNDLCDSFMFGDELPTYENDYEYSYTLFLPNSENDNNDNEEYNYFYFVKKDIDENIIFEEFFQDMESFCTFWKVACRAIVSDWKVEEIEKWNKHNVQFH